MIRRQLTIEAWAQDKDPFAAMLGIQAAFHAQFIHEGLTLAREMKYIDGSADLPDFSVWRPLYQDHRRVFDAAMAPLIQMLAPGDVDLEYWNIGLTPPPQPDVDFDRYNFQSARNALNLWVREVAWAKKCFKRPSTIFKTTWKARKRHSRITHRGCNRPKLFSFSG